jgi:hypothetical protein
MGVFNMIYRSERTELYLMYFLDGYMESTESKQGTSDWIEWLESGIADFNKQNAFTFQEAINMYVKYLEKD